MANITDPVRTENTYYITSSATPNVYTDIYNNLSITALAENITSMTSGLSGVPVDFQSLTVRIKDDGTARAITWGAKFVSKGGTLPTTTVVGATTTVHLEYDITSLTWFCVDTVVSGQEPDGVWTAFTPTLSGLFTDADWTKECKYIRNGKTVTARYYLKATDATPMGGAGSAIIASLPTTAASVGGASAAALCGAGYMYDASAVAVYSANAIISISDLSSVTIRAQNASGTYLIHTLTHSTIIPFTWTTNDEVVFQITYEAA